MINHLLVLERNTDPAVTVNNNVKWNCRCDCGKIVIVRSDAIKKQESCGCIAARRMSLERLGKPNTKNATHGMTKTKTYDAWIGMKARCYGSNPKAIKTYGEKGIKVCERWLHSFENFLEDMGEKPLGRIELDRIDTDGNYEPGNCRWATPKTNQNNRGNNVRLELDGETKTLTQWAEELKTDASNLTARIKRGWSVRNALTKPVRAHKKYERKKT